MTARQKAFIAAFAKTGNISQAAKAAKVPRRDHYDWLAANSVYEAAFNDAREDAIELLEREARRRATRAKKPSDVLLIFMLKSLRPNVYRDNAQLQLTGAGGGPVSIEVSFVKP